MCRQSILHVRNEQRKIRRWLRIGFVPWLVVHPLWALIFHSMVTQKKNKKRIREKERQTDIEKHDKLFNQFARSLFVSFLRNVYCKLEINTEEKQLLFLLRDFPHSDRTSSRTERRVPERVKERRYSQVSECTEEHHHHLHYRCSPLFDRVDWAKQDLLRMINGRCWKRDDRCGSLTLRGLIAQFHKACVTHSDWFRIQVWKEKAFLRAAITDDVAALSTMLERLTGERDRRDLGGSYMSSIVSREFRCPTTHARICFVVGNPIGSEIILTGIVSTWRVMDATIEMNEPFLSFSIGIRSNDEGFLRTAN